MVDLNKTYGLLLTYYYDPARLLTPSSPYTNAQNASRITVYHCPDLSPKVLRLQFGVISRYLLLWITPCCQCNNSASIQPGSLHTSRTPQYLAPSLAILGILNLFLIVGLTIDDIKRTSVD